MTKNTLVIILEKLLRVSQRMKTRIILMGGIATSVFGRPRATYDIDGIISLTERDLKDLLVLLKKNGFKFDAKNPVTSIQGLTFITFYYPKYKTYVDLFLAKNEFQYGILKRAKKVKFQRLNLYIISPEDLILMKLLSGREKDLEDIREIILENISKLDFKYLKKWSKSLGVNVFLRDELKSLRVR